MLFLLFQIGKERYALETSHVVEVLPMLETKQLPGAPLGVSGIINYRGQPIPAIDVSEMLIGKPAALRMNTRIVIVQGEDGKPEHLVGLIIENVSGTLRKSANDFVDPGLNVSAAPYLGPVLMDERGTIQWIHERLLLPATLKKLLFSQNTTVAR